MFESFVLDQVFRSKKTSPFPRRDSCVNNIGDHIEE